MVLKRNITPLVGCVVLAFIVDQVAKIVVVNLLTPLEPPMNIIGSVFRFKLTYNPYGVFSLSFGPPVLYYLFSIVGIVVLVLVGLAVKDRLSAIVFGLIIGGAVGNIFDRVRLNYVIDFIDMGIGNVRWFTYNLADAFITVGAVFLLGRELFWKKEDAGKPGVDVE